MKLIFVVLPNQGPRIYGGHLEYQVADEVNISCIYGPSKPAAHLTWFINGNKASSHYLRYADVEIDFDGLETTALGLNFIVKEESFSEGFLTLKCIATIATVYWKSDNAEADRIKSFNSNQNNKMVGGNQLIGN